MARVSIVLLPSLAETLGSEAAFEEVLPDLENKGERTVRDLLNRLAARYFRFKRLVFDIQTQQLIGETLVFLNGRLLEPDRGLKTNLHDGDTLTFIPFIEGG